MYAIRSYYESTLFFYAPYITALAIIGMLYFAVRAVTEADLRRMFAYSSGSHLSLIVLGVLVANLYGVITSYSIHYTKLYEIEQFCAQAVHRTEAVPSVTGWLARLEGVPL